MISIVLIGYGNIGNHLYNVFTDTKGIEVIQVYNRSESALKKLKDKVATTTMVTKLLKADVYIIAASDDSIVEISKQLRIKDALVVHTSGSVGLSSLSKRNRSGSFYPLQTFNKEKIVDFKLVPVCIEAENKDDLVLLRQVAEKISDNVHEIASEQRKSLHLAAVFVNNFTNHMFHIGNEICAENKVPFAILSPLINETVDKLKNLSPFEAQTGPAKRSDEGTIEKHLEQLKQDTYKEIYKTISTSIKTTYGEKL